MMDVRKAHPSERTCAAWHARTSRGSAQQTEIVSVVSASRIGDPAKGGRMRRGRLGIVGIVAVIAAMWAMPKEAGALTTDKTRKIAMVYHCVGTSQACRLPGSSTYWGYLVEFIGGASYLNQNVTTYSQYSFASYLSSDPSAITNYDLVIWYNDAVSGTSLPWPTDTATIANAIKRYEMPTLLFDGQGFFASQALGLVPAKTGTTVAASSMRSIVRDHYGNQWHALVGNYVSSVDQTSASSVLDLAIVRTVDLHGTYDLLGNYKYTRPLHAVTDGAYDDLYRVSSLVDDRRHIVATGIRTNAPAPDTTVWNGGAYGIWNCWEFIHTSIAYLMTPKPGAPDIGQNTFTETDWTTQSRGFNFEIKRTYHSGVGEEISYLGPSWSFNHDQYIIWDKFNDQLAIYNGTGQAMQMDLVKGSRPAYPAGEVDDGVHRVFTNVNSPNPQVAIYYPVDSGHAEAQENMPLDGSGTPEEMCAGSDQSGRQYHTTPAKLEGFLVRDASGNKAFYARQTIGNSAYSHVVCWGHPAVNEVVNQWVRTRGGELAVYRIAYLEDAAGNRQDYYYRQESEGFESVSEDVLSCVVDTEGRGYYFDISWRIQGMIGGAPVPILNGVTMPYRAGLAAMPDILYEIGSIGTTFRVDSVTWGTSRWRGYMYDDPYESGWMSIPGLTQIQEKDPATLADRVVKEFEYEPYDVDNFINTRKSGCYFGWIQSPIPYTGRLLRQYDGATAGVDQTLTEYEYHVKDGYPNLDAKDLPYAVVWSTSHGARKAVQINGRRHTILEHQAYTSARSVSGSPLTGGDVMPGTCNTIPTGLDPTSSCPGWTKRYSTNYDGQVTVEYSPYNGTLHPKGRFINHNHLVDTVFNNVVITTNNTPADDEMLAFWRYAGGSGTEYWYLRFWLANEISNQTVGNDSVNYGTNTVSFDPVFNKPWKMVGPSPEYRVLGESRLDYMGDVTPSPLPTPEQLFNLTFGSVVSAGDYDWPSYLGSSYNPYASASITAWATIPTVCDRPTGWSDGSYSGNVICTVLQATTVHGDSDSRAQGAAVYAYDEYGRVKASRTAEGSVVGTYYDPSTVSPYKLVMRYGGTGDIIRYWTRFDYDWRGQVVSDKKGWTLLSNSETVTQRFFSYDEMGNTLAQETQDGVGTPVERQEFQYDAVGSKVAVLFDRCPTGSCDDEFDGVQPNDAGDELLHFMAHDSKGRAIADCSERTEGVYDCTTTSYFNDTPLHAFDKPAYERKYQGCSLTLGSWSTAEQIQSTLSEIGTTRCVSTELKQVRATAYDGKDRPYQVSINDGTSAARVTQSWYNFDDKVAATRDAADSDASGGYEYSYNEFDSKSRLLRTTDGLDSTLAMSKTGLVATAYWYDNASKPSLDKPSYETIGIPTVGSGVYTTNAYYGRNDFVYDERLALVGTKRYQYTAGTTPVLGTAGHVWSYRTLNQEGQPFDETTHTYAAGPVDKFTAVKSYDYDGFGRVALVSDGFSDTSVIYSYDALDRMVREERYDEEDPADMSELYKYGYDAADRKLWSANVNVDDEDLAHTTTFEYDGYGYLVSTVDPQCQQTVYSRDGRGNAVATYERFGATDGCGITPPAEPWYFDNSGGVQTYDIPSPPELAALDAVIRNTATYDYAGNITTSTDDHGDLTIWTRNEFGDVKLEILPDGLNKEIVRNLDGAITRVTYKRGGSTVRTVDLALDLFNRTKTVTVNSAVMQTFTYLNNGLPSTWTDNNLDNLAVATSATATRAWDTLGNIQSDGQTVAYVSGLGGSSSWTTSATFNGSHMVAMTLPTATGSQSLGWNRNGEGRLSAAWEINSSTPIAQFTWFGDKLVDKLVTIAPSVTLENNREVTTGVPRWDPWGRLEGQKYLISGDLEMDYEYSYNGNDRLTNENYDPENPLDPGDDDVTYALDNLDRVARYDYTRSGDKSFNYDEVDNLRQSWDPNVTPNPTAPSQTKEQRITTNGLNQVASVHSYGTQTQSLTYDDYGNLVKIDKAGTTTDDRCYTWDRMGRLVKVAMGDATLPTPCSGGKTLASFVYDAMGRRVSKISYTGGSASQRKSYRLFGDNVAEEHNRMVADGSQWLLVIHHEPGAVDRYLRWDKYTYAGSTWSDAGQWAPITDIRNNVVTLVNSSGGILPQDDRFYDLYGNDGAAPSNYMPYRFAGREYDAETGLYYNRTRYYSPEYGRFISMDSLGIWGDLNNYGNGYAYVGGMVNGLVDPDGKDLIDLGDYGNGLIYGFIAAFFGPVIAPSLLNQGDSENPGADDSPPLTPEQQKLRELEERLKKLEQESEDAEPETEDAPPEDGEDGSGADRKADLGGGEKGGLSPEDVHDIRNLLRRSQGGISTFDKDKEMKRLLLMSFLPGGWRAKQAYEQLRDEDDTPKLGAGGGSGGGDPVDDFFNPLQGMAHATGHAKWYGAPPSPAPDSDTNGAANNHKAGIQSLAHMAGWDLTNWELGDMQGDLNTLSTLTHGKVGPAVDPAPFAPLGSVYFYPTNDGM
jgi:RHS repeat-associated protein